MFDVYGHFNFISEAFFDFLSWINSLLHGIKPDKFLPNADVLASKFCLYNPRYSHQSEFVAIDLCLWPKHSAPNCS